MIAKNESVNKFVYTKAFKNEQKGYAMPKTKSKLKFIERERPEAYSCTLAVRVRPSEKKAVQEYAAANGVNLDTVLRSALVAAGILAA